jgi:hypothetical protein
MDSDPTPTEPDGFYVPSPPETEAYTELGDFTVDGETFQVRRRDSDGSIHYDWISGPNEGYGFSSFGGLGPVSHEYHDASIRDFLSAIDPATGYFFGA